MFVKPLSAVVMMLATTAAACAAPANESDDDKSASTTADESLALRMGDEAPQPLDYPVPVSPQWHDLKDWDLPRLARDTGWSGPVSNCELHMVKLYDPGRQRDIRVAVTVCP